MGWNKCAYINCDNKNNDTAMFRFPVKDKRRLPVWILNSGNEKLDLLTNAELRRRYVCVAHFPSSSILERRKRNRLKKTANPIHFKCTQVVKGPSSTTKEKLNLATIENKNKAPMENKNKAPMENKNKAPMDPPMRGDPPMSSIQFNPAKVIYTYSRKKKVKLEPNEDKKPITTNESNVNLKTNIIMFNKEQSSLELDTKGFLAYVKIEPNTEHEGVATLEPKGINETQENGQMIANDEALCFIKMEPKMEEQDPLAS